MLRLGALAHRTVVALATTVAVVAMCLSLLQLAGVFRIVPVLSGSMSGYAETGDAVVLRPVATADLRVGDVIAFHPPLPNAPLTLHRVVEREHVDGRVAVRTRGDANAATDPWLAQLVEDTTWRTNDVVLAGAGRPVLLLQDPRVRLAWLALTIGTVLAMVLRTIWDDDPDPAPVVTATHPTGLGRRAGAASALALVLGLVVLLTGRHGPGVAATLTTSVTAAQSVSSATEDGVTRIGLTATLRCSGGKPSGALLTWTVDASVDVASYELLEAPTLTANPGVIATFAPPADQYLHTKIGGGGSGEVWYRLRTVPVSGPPLLSEAVSMSTRCTAG